MKSSIKFLLLFSLSIFLFPIGDSFAEIQQEGVETGSDSKISATIQQWQSSSDPNSFAQTNDLKFTDGKIRVYIYLDSPEFISELPANVEIITSADNIMVSSVSSQQITELSQLDFVQKITLPVSPNFFSDPTEITETKSDNFNYIVIIMIIVVIASIIYAIRRKRSNNLKINDNF